MGMNNGTTHCEEILETHNLDANAVVMAAEILRNEFLSLGKMFLLEPDPDLQTRKKYKQRLINLERTMGKIEKLLEKAKDPNLKLKITRSIRVELGPGSNN